ncbi:hypothetical protein VSDG_07683 [Cytospora chrysosperma]|uniref:Heterokaryon incompatibility domain-containing protein n=1 Tax=Cytospora chrysosperma TaxID=252740 RepID=A0A423VJ61_CYTCH|nr:hypothetical protein VSDG_07683 [Valsa sordida]
MTPEINVDLLRNWMQSCDSQHDKCRLETPDIAEPRIRLVDVEGERVVSASLAEDYVALSYVWGPNTVPLLTRGTLPQYTALRGLRCSAIPRTISDAIEVVKAIGKRYLWVDSLCILQDDARDKQQQLPIMDRIYSHADLVIIAAAGHDAHSGLPGVGKTEKRMLQHSDTIDGIDFVTAQPGVKQALEWTTWSSRGWTYQEAMLARRALIFTDTVVYWNCRDAIWREDMTGESLGQDVKHLLSANNSIWGHFADQYMKAVCRTAVYSEHVAEFSTRSFKDERDVLWAFLGVLKLQAPRFQKGFIWGLPYERLDATLLWSENVRCRGVHQRDAHHAMVHGSRSYDIPYPSWSWLSTNTRVSFMHPCGDSVISRIIWHEPYKLGDNDETSATWLKSVTTSKTNTADAGHQSPSTDWLSGVDGMDFGLLNFTAKTARLTIKIDQDSSTSLPETDLDGEMPGN